MGLQHLSKERRREIAAKGGASAKTRTFSDPEKAREAALKRWRGMLDNDRADEQE